MNQPHSPKDERIVSPNRSPDAAITGPSSNSSEAPRSSGAAADNNAMYPPNNYGSLEQTYFYGGYDGGAGSWSGFPQFAGAEGLHVVPPVIYGDNSSLGLHSPFGFNSAYGQYSPASTPVPQMMVDNQLFSPQQIPVSPQYYPQHVGSSMPHMSAATASHAEMATQKGNMSMNALHNHGYYNLHGMYGSGENLSSPSNSTESGWRTLTSTAAYTQPVGSFDPTVGQISQQRAYPGYGFVSDYVSGPYHYDGSFRASSFSGIPNSQQGASFRNRQSLEKARSQREQDSLFAISSDRNRGPRALKGKGKGTAGNGSLPGTENATENDSLADSAKNGASASGGSLASYNSADFPIEYENAKFFIIKSFSEDNIHRSIKYGIWASTPHGNRKLDAAYQEAKEKGDCPVFLLFSVNASGQFCGVAEMTGPVDFDKNADYWQQDRWTGQFTVRWHLIKDIPNSKFRHIVLENNDNKPVTHSRDAQEVKLDLGIEMLKIFKEYDAQTSILDDFEFYDEREKVLQERKTRQQAKAKPFVSESPTDEIVNNISDRFDQTLHLDESCKDVVATEESSNDAHPSSNM
ncbi:YTH domain-containing protein ECT1-like isoform X1 [Amaranthus tricolor]|uniref:YTH domain-containing protein ECT1-like isoform X1 n=1 Tax=Amaranthus tricolor TaxID=29722 RepID=UPI00258C4111|nr:YTH domain-containing protein ECT1-like isoform X1 [Amaranthus tricolor]